MNMNVNMSSSVRRHVCSEPRW